MKDKPKPRLTPEQNEARQAARAASRERTKDARHVALMAAIMQHGTAHARLADAWTLLALAKDMVNRTPA